MPIDRRTPGVWATWKLGLPKPDPTSMNLDAVVISHFSTRILITYRCVNINASINSYWDINLSKKRKEKKKHYTFCILPDVNSPYMAPLEPLPPVSPVVDWINLYRLDTLDDDDDDIEEVADIDTLGDNDFKEVADNTKEADKSIDINNSRYLHY